MLLGLLLCCTQQPIAILQSGARVETNGSTVHLGQRSLQTPYGRYNASLDPVVALADGAEDLALLAPLKNLDYEVWLQRVSERGFVSALLALDVPTKYRTQYQQVLENWGQKLDPLPPNLDRDHRVETLWARLQKAEDGSQLLLTGALLHEISASSQALKRRVSFSNLQKALRSTDPEVQRAAARLAQRQQESGLYQGLLGMSLENPQPSLRDVAADAAYALDQEQSLGRWTVALWRRGPEQERLHAVEHLGDFGSRENGVVQALILALGAESSSMAPRSSVFFGRQISAVTDFDVEVASSAVIANPVVTTLVEGVALEVRVVSLTLGRAIRSTLTHITGVTPGPKRGDWVAWYQQQGD